jgi:hypothetical protein
MTRKSHVQKIATRLRSLSRRRVKILIAGVLGGGTIIAFPAASAAVGVYVLLLFGTIGMMAVTGATALVSVAIAALLLPVLAIMTVCFAVVALRRFISTAAAIAAAPTGDVEKLTQVPATGAQEQIPQEGLDDWETDGGSAAPRRSRAARAARRRARHRHRSRHRPAPAPPSLDIR